MCLESRSAALLVALCSIVTSDGGGSTASARGRPAATIHLSTTSRISQAARSRDLPAMRNGAQIRGRLVAPDHQKLTNGALVMTPQDSDGSAASIDGALVPDGSFVFENVPPGTYLIRALAQTTPNALSLFALFRVTVRDSDVDGMALVLRPAATISGQIIIHPRSRARPSTGSGRPELAAGHDPRSGDDAARSASLTVALAGVRVRAPFNDDGSFGAARPGEPARDGTFTVDGVMGGAHLLVLEGLPIPWCVKNVSYRGQDITDTGLQADSGQRLTDVSITVTDQASEVSGTVRDGDGRAVPGARVLFVPVPAGLWPVASRRYARTIADTSGRYVVRGLPAGDYKVTAALELADRDLYRRDILRAVRDQGLAISLAAEQISIVDLSLIQLRLQQYQLAER